MELTPKTRKETFLAAAGGQDVTTPTPITREEVFLDAIAKGGGSGGGSSGGGVLVVNDVDLTLDKTWKEINDAGFAVLHFNAGGATSVGLLYSSQINGGLYGHIFCNYLGGSSWAERIYVATSESGYPTYYTPGG